MKQKSLYSSKESILNLLSSVLRIPYNHFALDFGMYQKILEGRYIQMMHEGEKRERLFKKCEKKMKNTKYGAYPRDINIISLLAKQNLRKNKGSKKNPFKFNYKK